MRISLQAINRSGLHEEFASAISDMEPAFDEGAVIDNPALYHWAVTAPVARSQAEADGRFSSCPAGGGTDNGDGTESIEQPLCALPIVQVIVADPERTFWVFGEKGLDCVNQRMSGEGILTASYLCEPNGNRPLRIQARF